MDYFIVLFKNKKRKKIINKFKNLDRAKLFFDKKILASESVVFEKLVENASECVYELALISNSPKKFDNYFIKDFLGRQIKVDIEGDFEVLEIKSFKVPELIYDISNKEKITFEEFDKKYLNTKKIKLISKLNNKIVFQEDSVLKLFSLKNDSESERFLICLREYLMNENRSDCIIVTETSKSQKKYLYEILSVMGIEKKLLYRNTTTFKPR